MYEDLKRYAIDRTKEKIDQLAHQVRIEEKQEVKDENA